MTEVTLNAKACSSAGSGNYPSFKGCSNLSTVNIGENVTAIPTYLFQDCNGLIEVNYNAMTCASAGSSSYSTFEESSCLTSINIGENVKSMPNYLFKNYTSTTKIKSLASTPPTLEDETFDEFIGRAEVPMDNLIKYASDDSWSKFPTIYAVKDDDTYYPALIIYMGDAIVSANGGDENGVILKEGSTVVISPINGGGQLGGFVEHMARNITTSLNSNGQYSFALSKYHKENCIYSYSVDANNTYDITVSAAGQVLEQVTVANINSVYYLKVHGDINGTDILTIRRMPNLQILDLSEANVVSGGDCYYNDTYSTSKNVVGQYFFMDMTSLKIVKLPNSATNIRSYAFGNCTGLASIEISANIEYIDTHAFSGCTNMDYLTINDSSESLKIYTSKDNSYTPFADCPFGVVYLGRTLTYDYSGEYTLLYGKGSITSLTIGDNVTNINDYEFYDCSHMASNIVIPKGVTSIGKYAFNGCKCMPSVSTGNSVTTVGEYAFNGCKSMTTLYLGSGLTNIGEYAFYNCSSLKAVEIPDNITTINAYTFSGCSRLSSLNLGNGVAYIEEHAFSDCSALTDVSIPSNVMSIENYAFNNSGITNLTIKDSTKKLSFTTTSKATPLDGCPIESLYLGRIISYDSSYSPFRGNTNLTSLSISNNVTAINTYAFRGCTGLTEVVVPNSVTDIGSYAFYNCSGITSLTIGNQVTSIGNYAFYGCEGLTEVKTPNSINTIGSYAFADCTSLTTLTLGSSCSTINDYAFNGCSALEELYSKNTDTPSINGTTFNDVDKETCILYVPTGSLNKYWLHTYWTEFFNIQEMDFDPNDDTDGIESVSTSSYNAEVTGYYTIDGKAMDAPQKGVNIVKYSNGSTKKVLVK
ncbi:MAG: leucine-rich repeat domain-containing protein [Prevotella sp.]|nr:leucine-rich repeat domain-containing protein [Prevotella sp.]